MREIGDLGLTLKQTLEVSTLDRTLVDAWLEQVDDPSVPNPTAWFLTGVRSGLMPGDLGDRRRDKALMQAERYIVNSLYQLDREEEVLDELFGDRGRLRHWADDELLRHRMLTLWREERPRGERLEREAAERAERQRETWAKLHGRA